MPVRLNGSTSGFVELAAPAAAGSTTLELPTDSIKPGLVLVAQESFSAVSAVSVDGCFTSDYDNYSIVAFMTNSSATTNQLRLRVSGADSTSSYSLRSAYFQSIYSTTTETTSVRLGDNGTEKVNFIARLSSPFEAAPTVIYADGNDSAATSMFSTGGIHSLSTSYDGVTLFCNSGTFTGSLSIYGYRSTL